MQQPTDAQRVGLGQARPMPVYLKAFLLGAALIVVSWTEPDTFVGPVLAVLGHGICIVFGIAALAHSAADEWRRLQGRRDQ